MQLDRADTEICTRVLFFSLKTRNVSPSAKELMLLLLFLCWVTVPKPHDLEAVCTWEETGLAGAKERFSLHTLPEAAQVVKRPEGQPKSTSQRKSKCIAQTEGPNAAGIRWWWRSL